MALYLPTIFLMMTSSLSCLRLLIAVVFVLVAPGHCRMAYRGIRASSGVLTSPKVTDLGEWGEWDRCPPGTYVMGMRLKLEPYQGPLDDTGLNGIQFHCGRLGESSKEIQGRRIESLVGVWGSWGHPYVCRRGYALGFQLRSEGLQEENDDTGANNLRLFCAGSKGYLEGPGLQWGEWTEPQRCPPGQAICGMRTQVQPSQGRSPNADDTALNNLSVECCSV